MVHITADGMSEAIYPVALVPAAIEFVLGYNASTGPLQLTTFSPDTDITVTAFADTQPLGYNSSGTLRPGASPITIPLTSSQPTVARPLVSSVTINPGSVSVSFKLRALAAGDTVLQAQPPSTFTGRTDLAHLAVHVGRPSFSPQQVQAYRGTSVPLVLPQLSNVQLPGAILLTLTSSDPNTVLLSAADGQPGQPRITVSYGPGGPYGPGYVQGISLGTATITVSAAGFDDSQVNVTVGLPLINLSGNGSTLYVGPTGQLTVSTIGTVIAASQMTVNLQSSDQSVATVATPVVIPSGKSQATAAVTPISPGQVTISADGTGFSPLSTLTSRLSVALPPLPFSVPPTLTVGRNLQTAINNFSTAALPLTITSSDPTLVLISPDGKSKGSASLTAALKQYAPTNFYIQSLADTGTATVTFSSPGYASSAVTVNPCPSAFQFDRQVLNLSKTNPFTFSVAPVAVQAGYPTSQSPWAPVTVAIASSQPAIGSLTPSSVTFKPGDSSAAVTFTPAASGSTVLTFTPPAGFVQTNPPSQLVVTVQ
jgi:hypothetical protein